MFTLDKFSLGLRCAIIKLRCLHRAEVDCDFLTTPGFSSPLSCSNSAILASSLTNGNS